MVELPKVIASDVGVQRHFSIKNDAIFNTGQRLSNYRDYYFAVTAYVVNLEATPKVIESPISTIRIAPSAPDYGTTVAAVTGARADMAHTGTGDGEFFYKVVDPTLLVDGTYNVSWNDDSTPEEGAYTWNLSRNGTPVLDNQPLTGRDSEGNPQDDAPIVDGIQIQVLPGTFSTPATFFNSEAVVDANASLVLWGDGTLFGNATGLWFEFTGGPQPTTEDVIMDIEFRFTGVTVDGDDDNDKPIASGGQWTTQWEQSSFGELDLSTFASAPVRSSFELWDIENNRQLSYALINRNADAGAPYGGGVGDANTARYRMSGRDYVIVLASEYPGDDVAQNTSFAHNDPKATWLLFFEQGGDSQWNTGDVFRIQFANPTITTGGGADSYTFTTAKSVLTNQANVAQQQLKRINIVPNPYWAHNPLETDPINRFVRITNLPGTGTKIRIFTLAGELVRVIDDNDRTENGTGGLQFANWDLRNDAGVPIASGVYIVHIEVNGVGTVVRKAAIFQPEERLDIF